MLRMYLSKINKRLSLVEPNNHPVHNILVTVPEAYYILIRKDNGAYLIATTNLITSKVEDHLDLINERTGNTLGYGTIKAIVKAAELTPSLPTIKALVKANELYFYLITS